MDSQNSLTDILNRIIDEGIEFKDINNSAKEISLKYRNNNNDGVRLVQSKKEALAYALSRMPATYGAISSCMEHILELKDFKIHSVGDYGAGTGAATWAICDKIDGASCTCFEREPEMINIGSKLMDESAYVEATWKRFDIVNDDITSKHDLVVSSYMINELSQKDVIGAVSKLWDATNEILLIVEPGTPNGYSNILKARAFLLQQGAYIIAPCTHQNECKLEEGDWCHFTCRVQRSKTHKMLKSGSSPFEDEKFSYIAVSRNPVKMAENRIMRHPIINKGFSEYKVCSKDGVKDVKLSKKDGSKYKEAKKKSAGDSLNI